MREKCTAFTISNETSDRSLVQQKSQSSSLSMTVSISIWAMRSWAHMLFALFGLLLYRPELFPPKSRAVSGTTFSLYDFRCFRGAVQVFFPGRCENDTLWL